MVGIIMFLVLLAFTTISLYKHVCICNEEDRVKAEKARKKKERETNINILRKS